jgi:hypothetical protein
VPYRDRRGTQVPGLKLLGQWSRTRKGGVHPVREARDCQHHGGQELGRDGMANRSALPLNVVMIAKPKVLTGLNQKVRGQGSELRSSPPAVEKATGG